MQPRPATGGLWDNLRRLGLKNTVTLWLATHLSGLWDFLNRPGLLKSATNENVINQFVTSMEPRPDRLSTKADYTSWDSLTDRTFSGRHLPPWPSIAHLPDVNHAQALFERSGAGFQSSKKSTLLFPFFAQWFVDGFLVTDPHDPRRNHSTHDIDLSQLYGPTRAITNMLRRHYGGELKYWKDANDQIYPPLYFDAHGNPKPEFNGLPLEGPGVVQPASAAPGAHFDRKAPPTGLDPARRAKLFALGLPRGNIHYGTLLMSTVFLREHNRLARAVIGEKGWDPVKDDERIFQTARNILIVKLLKIVIEEYINHIQPFTFKFACEPGTGAERRWFRPNWMAIEFDLLYRWHTLMPNEVEVVPGTTLPLSHLRWNTQILLDKGVAELIDRASKQLCMEICLFNTPADLLKEEKVAIQIGRDVRLAGYNDYRQACGYPRLRRFDDLSSNTNVQDALKALYNNDVDNIELYVGLFAEDVVEGGVLPLLMGTMVGVDAFSQALTNPLLDPRIFSEDTFTKVGMAEIQATERLEHIVLKNISPGPEPRVSFQLE